MAPKIWHFLGLPDPEENVERKKPVIILIIKLNNLGKKISLEIETTTVQSELPKAKLNGMDL